MLAGLWSVEAVADTPQLPMSFFTSVFGMNVVEISDGSKITFGVAMAYASESPTRKKIALLSWRISLTRTQSRSPSS